LLSARLLDLAGQSNADQSVVRLELLQGVGRIVDEGETGCLSTTELGLETELWKESSQHRHVPTRLRILTYNIDLGNCGLVQLSELPSEFILGDVGAVWVKNVAATTLAIDSIARDSADVHDHLLAAQQRVTNELARAQRYGLVGHLVVGFGFFAIETMKFFKRCDGCGS
jgi:hypothetical protein